MKIAFPQTSSQILRGDVLLDVMRQFAYAKKISQLVVVSPWITPWQELPSFSWWIEEIYKRNLRTTVITRTPTIPAHLNALKALARNEKTRVYLNDSVHAKIIACPGPFPWGFGVVGSANITSNSLNQLEIAIMVLARSGGDGIIKELAFIGDNYLRSHIDTKSFKESDYRGF